MPLAHGVEPFVVDLRQKVAAIEIDRFADSIAVAARLDERIDVEPDVGLRVPSDFVAIDRDVSLRGPRQNFRQFAQRRAQLRSRRAFLVVGVKEEG